MPTERPACHSFEWMMIDDHDSREDDDRDDDRDDKDDDHHSSCPPGGDLLADVKNLSTNGHVDLAVP